MEGLSLSNPFLKYLNDSEYKAAAISIITRCPEETQYLKESLKDDPDIIIILLSTDISCIKYMSQTIQKRFDKSVLCDIFRRSPKLFAKAPLSYRDDEIIVKEMMGIDGSLLEYVSERLRKNADIVDAAIKQNKDSHKFSIMPDKYSRIEALLKELNLECSAVQIDEETQVKLYKDDKFVVSVMTFK